AASPRLRATHALALVVLIMEVVLLGTPGRRDRQEAMAQTPSMTPRPAAAAVPYPVPPELQGIDLSRQSAEEAAAKSAGCVGCHRGQHDPHGKPETVRLGCADCHGGNPQAADQSHAHVCPRFPDAWRSSGNPVRSYTLLNHESPEFIR